MLPARSDPGCPGWRLWRAIRAWRTIDPAQQ